MSITKKTAINNEQEKKLMLLLTAHQMQLSAGFVKAKKYKFL